MNEISNISNLIFPTFPAGSVGATPSTQAPRDAFRIGAERTTGHDHPLMSTAVLRAVELSSLAIARTRAVRHEIESGTYETPSRIDGTVERLLDVIV